MDYEKKYKNALELAKDYYKANQKIGKLDENEVLSDIFPELKESKDEKITTNPDGTHFNLSQLERVAKVEPKFKVGDKLVSTKNPRLTYKVLNLGNVNELGNLEYEIEIFIDEKPGIKIGGSFKEHNIHLMECVKVDKWAKLID